MGYHVRYCILCTINGFTTITSPYSLYPQTSLQPMAQCHCHCQHNSGPLRIWTSPPIDTLVTRNPTAWTPSVLHLVNSMMGVDVPTEILLHISKYIPDDTLKEMLAVNRMFYNFAMNLWYGDMLIATRKISTLKHLVRLQYVPSTLSMILIVMSVQIPRSRTARPPPRNPTKPDETKRHRRARPRIPQLSAHNQTILPRRSTSSTSPRERSQTQNSPTPT